MWRVIGLLLMALLLTACRVPSQGRPERIENGPITGSAPTTTPPGTKSVQVFFLRGERLELVTRAVPRVTVADALVPLFAGPTPDEARSGLRTALTPQPVPAVDGPAAESATVVIHVTAGFATVAGTNQLLGVAQVVWTATGVPGVQRVRFVLGGEPIEVPTDRGLTGEPVSRGEYRSVSRSRRRRVTDP